jgi:hypothetical protein
MSSTEYLPYTALKEIINSKISPNDSSVLSVSELKINSMFQEDNCGESYLPTNQKKIKINESNEAKLISNIKK